MIEELCKALVIGTGGAATLVLTPALLALMGFTTAGITAGSIAAWLMSWCALHGGIGLGVIAFLQSIGTGFSWLGLGYVGGGGALLGWLLSSICNQTISHVNIVFKDDQCPI